jgi:hypothetical protein
MDKELETFLLDMEGRLNVQITNAADATQKRLSEQISVAERRLMTRINAISERLGDRVTDAEDGVLLHGINLQTMARQILDLQRRLRKLEGDDGEGTP